MEQYAILLLDDTGYIFCNRRAEELFGVPREQLLHAMPCQFSPDVQPDGQPSQEKALRKIRAALSGEPQTFAWAHRRADGAVFDAEINLSRIEIAGRAVLLVILRDLSGDNKAERERRESELMFRSIVENSHSGIFTIDAAFRITYANDMVGQMLGRDIQEIIGHDFREFLDEESARLVADRYLRRQHGEEVPSRYEFNIVRQDGEKRRVEISSSIIRDGQGGLKTVGQVLDVTERQKAERGLQLVQQDLEMRVEQRTTELRYANSLLQNEINRRERIEAALRQSELKYRHLVQSANTIILEMDTEGRVTFFNHFAEDLFGFSEAEILGKSVLDTIVPRRDSSDRDLDFMIQDIIHNPERYCLNENENMKRNGERVWVVWSNQPLFDEKGQLKEILCVGIDRTAQKNQEEAMACQAREQAATEERSRLARDLHDAVSQTLFSASIIAEVLPRLWEKNPDEARRRLEEVRQLTRGALAEMRTLLLELRPAALVEAEAGYLLQQLGESVAGRSRITVKVAVEGQCALPVEVKVALYRIAQEALNNVAKHAQADEALVHLACREDGINLEVKDNGRGFDVASVPPDSLGLGIMRERARDIGASLSIESQPGQGTKVRVGWDVPAAHGAGP